MAFKRFSRHCLATIVSVSALIAATQAVAQQNTYELDIDAQPMAEALSQLAEQADVTILSSASVTESLTAEAFEGEYTLEEALERLLEGTPLSAEIRDNGVVYIRRIEDEVTETRDAPVLTPAPQAPPAEENDQVEENNGDVVVVRGFRRALADSLQFKRNAGQVADGVSSEEIGKFPDQNIAEALQRISGVQITRTNGNGESISVRGLAPTFTRVEIDGRSTIVSTSGTDTNNPQRSTVLTEFATELYDTAQVIKSPTAADVEGGVGGTVRLKTPDPLKIGKNRYGVELNAIDATHRDFIESNVNGFANWVSDNERVGALVQVVYRHDDRSYDDFFNSQSGRTFDDNFKKPDDSLLPYADAIRLRKIQYRERSGDNEIWNLNGKLQFRPVDELDVYGTVFFGTSDRTDFDRNIAVNPDNGNPIPLWDVFPDAAEPVIVNENNSVIAMAWDSARVEFENHYKQYTQDVFGIGGGLTWEPNERWTIKLEANDGYSDETRKDYRADARTGSALAAYSLEENSRFPAVTVFDADATFDNILDGGIRTLDSEDRIIRTDETVARLDVERFVGTGLISSLQFGMRYSELGTERQRVRVKGLFEKDGDNLSYRDALEMFGDSVDGEFAKGIRPDGGLYDWPGLNPEPAYELAPSPYEGDFSAYDIDGVDISPQEFITEETLAGYLLANFDTQPMGLILQGNAGLRIVNTKTTGVGVIDIEETLTDEFGTPVDEAGDPIEEGEEDVVYDPAPFLNPTGIDGDITNYLPAVNFTLASQRRPDLLLRGAVTRSLSRPNFNQLTPSVDIRTSVTDLDTREPVVSHSNARVGNPDLQPFLAWQYDLGVEYYFGENGEGGVSLGFFYKDIEETIVNGTTIVEQVLAYEGRDYVVGELRQPVNGGDAKVQGYEVGLQTPFTFLPAPLSDFGFFGNYTYTDSETTDENGNTVPLEGNSEDTYNAAFYYERGGFSARMAYNFRGAYVRNADEIVDDFGRVDLALRYRMKNGVRLSFDVLNLNQESDFRYDINGGPDRPLKYEYEDVIYKLGLGFTF